ncbi:MAG: energy transducer TonB [Bryobacterales bacterium]|nr:energy transducer TonB [Bryobacterales bacterium]
MFILASFWLSGGASRHRRWGAFLSSIVFHLSTIAVLLIVDSRERELLSEKQYRLTMLPKQDSSQRRVIWYDFRRAVPEVAPQQQFGPGDKPQAEKTIAPKAIVAQSSDPSSKQQLIWRPDRPQQLPNDIPAPNLVALPEPPAPPKPEPKRFVPPPAAPPKPVPRAPTMEAPSFDPASSPGLRAGTPNLDIIDNRPKLPKPPPRQLVLPPGGQGAGAPVRQEIQDAPQIPAGGGGSVQDLKAVIVGLNPADKLSGPPPEGSRGAQFSQAPDLGPPSSGPAGNGAAVRVPGLVARGDAAGGSVASPAPVAGAVPDRRALREIRLPPINRTLSAPLRPSARVIPATVESLFANRNVYTLLIPGPDIANYRGDWVLWFSARQAPETGLGSIAAPVPVRKFSLEGDDPGEAEASGTMQMAAIIDRAGRVSSVKVLRGPGGEPGRKKAAEELLSWEFQPALNNGQPMEVDVVLEITFRPGPRQAR